MRRWIGLGLLGLLLLAAVAATGAFLFVGHHDFASLAAERASTSLGRPVAVGSLRVTLGQWITVEVRDLRVANVQGGTRPEMATLASLSAEVSARSLLQGPLVVRRLEAEGLSVLLERVGDGGATPNWRFERSKTAGSGQAGRARFPTLLDAHLHGSSVTFRTSSGKELRTRLDEASIGAETADAPVSLRAKGAYNDVPISLDGELDPVTVLRTAAPYRTKLRFASGDTVLGFDGTMLDPLNVDGASGTLTLDAPTLGALLAVAGVPGDVQVSLAVEGQLAHSGDHWQLSDAKGKLDDNRILALLLRLDEGTRTVPDQVAVDLTFDRLDLDEVLARGSRGARTHADLPLRIDRSPDVLVEARLAAREFAYAGVHASNARLAGALKPGRVEVTDLELTYAGARVRASGAAEAAGEGGHVSASLNAAGVDVQQLRRVLRMGAVPLQGQLSVEAVATASGATLNAAAQSAHVSAVVAMRGGSIAREVVEMASTDVRLLFRKPRGTSPVSCLLAVLDMRSGAGTVSPLRLRAADGTIVGVARFDLARRSLDLTIGSEAATTSAFALDVPVRVSGSFADPSVRPAQWTPGLRASLTAAGALAHLPPGLRQAARRSQCLAGP